MVDGYLTITPITDEVTVTITGNNDTKVYNAAEQSVTGFTTDVGTKTISVDLKDGHKAEAKGTDVNTYYMGLTKDDFTVTSKNYSNIKVVVVDGYLTITPITAPITITANSAGKTYDGTALTDPGYTYTENVLLEGDTLTAVVEGSATNVGDEGKNVVKSYKVTRGDADVTGNYTFGNSVDGKLTINPRQIELTANSASKQYDGTPLTDSGYKITKGAFVTRKEIKDGIKVEIPEGLASVTVEGSQTLEGRSANTITGHELNGSTLAKNYDIKYVDGTLIVSQNEKVITVTANSYTWEYDGKEHSDGGYTVRYDGKTYTVDAGESQELPTGGLTLTATVVGTVKDVKDSAKDNNVVTVVTITDAAGNVVNDQFKTITLVPGTLTITLRGENPEKPVELIADNSTVPYDGKDHGYVGHTAVYLADGHSVSSVKSDFTAKYVGFYEKKIDLYDAVIVDENGVNVTENYKITYKNGDLRIVPPNTVVVTIEGNTATEIYNGNPQTVTGYKVISISNSAYTEADFGFADGAKAEATGTNVGMYNMGLTKDSFVNNNTQNFTSVTFEVKDGWIDITPYTEEVTVTITGNTATEVYNATEQSVSGFTTDVGTKTISVKLNETGKDTAKGTNVGKYYMGLTAKNFTVTSKNYSNIKVIVVDGYLDITPITGLVVVTITGNKDTKVYNGKEQSVTGYTTDVGTKTISVKLNETGKDTAKGTNAGTYPMGLTVDDFTVTSGNYNNIKVIVKDGSLKITPITDRVTVTVTEKSASHVYNGTERSITGYKSMTADNALYTVKTNVAETPTDKWTAKGTNTGKYPVGIKAGDFKNTSGNFTNVVFVIVDGALEITPVTSKVTVTVTEKSAAVTYDAKLHSITGYESMTADNALYDVTANVKAAKTAAWTAKGVEAGEYPVGIAAGDFKNTSSNFTNVEFVIVDGALTIEADDAEVIVTVTGNTKTVTYDGKEHSVEGYTVDVNGLPIKVTPKADLEAKASGTNAGTYYMGLTAADFTAESQNYSNIKIVVKDGYLKINPITATVTVTVTENKDTVEYDGKQHSVKGYVSMTSDHPLYDVANVAETPTAAWTAKGTDAGKYPVGIESGDFKNTSGNFTNVEFKIVDGALTITRRGANPESPVTLRAKDGTVVFDGKYHGYVGQTATNLAPGQSVRSVESDFTARNVGLYTDKIDLHDAIIVDANGRDVTHNYVLTYIPGTLEITPYEGEVLVTVTGSNGVFRYDGRNHTVSGYTMEASVPFFTMNDIRFTGKAEITKARPGDYMMGLKTEGFSVANGNFTNVKFTVIDGGMRIYTVRYTVAWMFDTDQMLTGDQSNRYFSAMANYIDRSDISLVLHTGNVVADAKDQSQWDVYNNAMQPLYDDEDTDVLMIAAEKEAADGSLFLQQPVREDFKEEDLFENGKGFVRRFNIGEKSVILVGLGADALTEEGYKWAREKFDSDKDASGILMVNTYLLEDMTKDEKIDESALDIEKEIVKACSNVRMVLSSSGGYSCHYEFFYGERKVIAINSDIEAAAKAGYFTMLTFNEDLNILSVTNLCPYTYDFVYNERQAYKECYVLNDVL